jgi:hypothetical protein
MIEFFGLSEVSEYIKGCNKSYYYQSMINTNFGIKYESDTITFNNIQVLTEKRKEDKEIYITLINSSVKCVMFNNTSVEQITYDIIEEYLDKLRESFNKHYHVNHTNIDYLDIQDFVLCIFKEIMKITVVLKSEITEKDFSIGPLLQKIKESKDKSFMKDSIPSKGIEEKSIPRNFDHKERLQLRGISVIAIKDNCESLMKFFIIKKIIDSPSSIF